MITHFINWVKGLFTFKKEEPVVLEEPAAEEVQTVDHCESHLRFRKNCPNCLRAIGAI